MPSALHVLAAVAGLSLLGWGVWSHERNGRPNPWIAIFAGPQTKRMPVLALIVGFYLSAWGVLPLLARISN